MQPIFLKFAAMLSGLKLTVILTMGLIFYLFDVVAYPDFLAPFLLITIVLIAAGLTGIWIFYRIYSRSILRVAAELEKNRAGI